MSPFFTNCGGVRLSEHDTHRLPAHCSSCLRTPAGLICQAAFACELPESEPARRSLFPLGRAIGAALACLPIAGACARLIP